MAFFIGTGCEPCKVSSSKNLVWIGPGRVAGSGAPLLTRQGQKGAWWGGKDGTMPHSSGVGSKGAADLAGIKKVLATSSAKLDLKNPKVVAALGQVKSGQDRKSFLRWLLRRFRF